MIRFVLALFAILVVVTAIGCTKGPRDLPVGRYILHDLHCAGDDCNARVHGEDKPHKDLKEIEFSKQDCGYNGIPSDLKPNGLKVEGARCEFTLGCNSEGCATNPGAEHAQ